MQDAGYRLTGLLEDPRGRREARRISIKAYQALDIYQSAHRRDVEVHFMRGTHHRHRPSLQHASCILHLTSRIEGLG
ncbi:MAG: hypothetical protein NZ742_05095 [Acidobacteria bacterium]|nr:hypothetical protein [Acidobacteriota bacterium]MDW7984230.1 hypothetical protein [Acidobacteriota bacterium]